MLSFLFIVNELLGGYKNAFESRGKLLKSHASQYQFLMTEMKIHLRQVFFGYTNHNLSKNIRFSQTRVEELHKNNLPSDDQILILQKRLNASKNTAHAISKQHKALSAATTVVFAQKRYIQDQMSISEEEMEDTYNAFEKCYSDVGNQLFYFQRFYDQSFYNGIPFDIEAYLDFFIALNLVSFHRYLTNPERTIVKSCPFLYIEECVNVIIEEEYSFAKSLKTLVKKKCELLLKEIKTEIPKDDIELLETLEKISEATHIRSQHLVSSDINLFRETIKEKQKKALTIEQEHLLQELQGTYNCICSLSRLNNKLKEAVGFSACIDYLEYFLYFRTPLPHHKKTKPLPRGFETNAKNSVLAKEFVDVLDVFNKYPALDIVRCIRFLFLQNYPNVQNLIDCLLALVQNKRNDALTAIKRFILDFDYAPYSLKKISSIIYIGLMLSYKKGKTPNFFDKYITAYLQTSMPVLTKGVFQEINPNFAIICIISEYNFFIMTNNLDFENLANPLDHKNAFLKKFFEKYSAEQSKDIFVKSKAAIKKQKTLLEKSQSMWPLDSQSLPNLDANLLTNLQLKIKNYEGTKYIQQFLGLPKEEQDIINKVCLEELEKTQAKTKNKQSEMYRYFF